MSEEHVSYALNKSSRTVETLEYHYTSILWTLAEQSIALVKQILLAEDVCKELFDLHPKLLFVFEGMCKCLEGHLVDIVSHRLDHCEWSWHDEHGQGLFGETALCVSEADIQNEVTLWSRLYVSLPAQSAYQASSIYQPC